jgi:hypothetical protein
MSQPIKPALTRQEWKSRSWLQCFDSWDEEESDHSGVGEIHVHEDSLLITEHEHRFRANFSAPSDRHRLAALALYGLPFGFTRRDVMYVKDAIKDLEKADIAGWPIYESELGALADRIAALLPPEPE